MKFHVAAFPIKSSFWQPVLIDLNTPFSLPVIELNKPGNIIHPPASPLLILFIRVLSRFNYLVIKCQPYVVIIDIVMHYINNGTSIDNIVKIATGDFLP